MDFEIVSEITAVETIASGNGVRDRNPLAESDACFYSSETNGLLAPLDITHEFCDDSIS